MTRTCKDQMNRDLEIPMPVLRIVSLVPSLTEMLADLGLDNEVAGITDYCVHPAHWKKSKILVGGTKRISLERIGAIEPDLIIANKEENEQQQILSLMEQWPVWISDVHDLPGALDMIGALGHILDREEQADSMIRRIQDIFPLPPAGPLPSALYLIWRKPWMAAGEDTFIGDMMTRLGVRNALGPIRRYPQVSLAEMAAASPDWVLLSSEPFPFKQKHAEEIRAFLPGSKILLVDGEMFSWYGSRILKAAGYFRELRKTMGLI